MYYTCRKPHNMMVIASTEIKSPRTEILTNDTPVGYKFTDKISVSTTQTT